MNPISEIFNVYDKNKINIEVSIDKMVSDLSRYADRILLYGAGSAGLAFLYFLKRIDILPQYFLDADASKRGSLFEGIPILHPEKDKANIPDDALVIVCINTDGKRYCKSFDEALRSGGHHAVYKKLASVGCRNIIDYSYFRKCFCFFKDEKYNAPSCSDVYLMEKNQHKIEAVYDILKDEQSKMIYEKIIYFRLLDDAIDIPTSMQDNQYFEDEYYQKNSNEIFVDCGAFNGISLNTFLQCNEGLFSKYYGFEPDSKNFQKLKDFIDTLPIETQKKLNIYEAAVWENNKNIRLYTLGGPGSFVADIGHEAIKTVTIDDILNGEPATFIKMNIEGSEKEALTGAAHTIQTYKPKLAIAGYHRTEDLWEIPLMIKKYQSDYSIYLKTYMNHISFVYYAV